jgi:predicted nucleotidyltransferase
MSVFDSFARFRKSVDADPEQVVEARERRIKFENALLREPDVVEVIRSGSLARGTHKAPIHDVDLVVVYERELHQDWDQVGTSAEEALQHTREIVHRRLGATSGTDEKIVRLALPRNHAVKCFLDDPEDENAFTVDVMPAFRVEVGLTIPEVVSEGWVRSDPEYLIRAASDRHTKQNRWAGSVRMLKRWAADRPFRIKSLVMEVLALDHLPTDRNQPGAIQAFFASAAYAVESGLPIDDPAGLCGPIQPDLDTVALGDALRAAATDSQAAIVAQTNNDDALATRKWAKVFGGDFPVIVAASGAPSEEGPRPVKDSPQG